MYLFQVIHVIRVHVARTASATTAFVHVLLAIMVTRILAADQNACTIQTAHSTKDVQETNV